MSIKVSIKHAIVKKFYNSDEVLKEFNSEKGTIFKFEIQTKVNDSAPKCPFFFQKCTIFTKTAEEAEYVRNTISENTVLGIEGFMNRSSYEDKNGNKQYSDFINVKEIIPITDDNSNDSEDLSDEDLPF